MKKPTSFTLSTFALTALMAINISHAVAGNNQVAPTRATPTFKATSATMPAQPKCAQGFTVVNKVLSTAGGGKQWYVYDCARQEDITMVCNPNLTITNIELKSTPSIPVEGGALKTRVTEKYSCFHMEG